MCAHPRRSGIQNGAALVALLLALTVYSIHLFRHPPYNWDTLPYMAVALIDTGESVADAHHDAYAAARTTIPSAQYDVLVGATTAATDESQSPCGSNGNLCAQKYMQDTAANARIFAESLPFYTVKPVYPALIAVLHAVGGNLVYATVILALIGYVFSCVVMFFWIGSWLPQQVALPLAILLAFIPQLTGIANMGAPDSLSVFVILLAVFLIMERERTIAGLSMLIVAIAVRPEDILYAMTFTTYCYLFKRQSRLVIVALGLGAILLFLVVTRTAHDYGWTTLFYFTFVDHSIKLPGFVSPLRLGDYFVIYRHQLFVMFYETYQGLRIFAPVLFGAAAMNWRGGDLKDPYLSLVVLICLLTAARVALLPLEADRALLALYLLATMALIRGCAYRGYMPDGSPLLHWRRHEP